MPTHRRQPRAHACRLYHTTLEIQKLLAVVKDSTELLLAVHNHATMPSNQKRRVIVLLLSVMTGSATLLTVPRMTDDIATPRKDHTHFEEVQFKKHFMFRKHDFYRVLCSINMTASPDDPTPRVLYIGSNGTQSTVASDWAFMVLLKRLSSGCHYRDIKCVLGGSTTALSNTFLHMLDYLRTTYKERLSDLKFYRPVLPDCVRLLNNLCLHHHNIPMPHNQVVGFVDGHFQVVLPKITNPSALATAVPTDTHTYMYIPATVLTGTDACAKTCSIATSTTEKLDGEAALHLSRHPACTLHHAPRLATH